MRHLSEQGHARRVKTKIGFGGGYSTLEGWLKESSESRNLARSGDAGHHQWSIHAFSSGRTAKGSNGKTSPGGSGWSVVSLGGRQLPFTKRRIAIGSGSIA